MFPSAGDVARPVKVTKLGESKLQRFSHASFPSPPYLRRKSEGELVAWPETPAASAFPSLSAATRCTASSAPESTNSTQRVSPPFTGGVPQTLALPAPPQVSEPPQVPH